MQVVTDTGNGNAPPPDTAHYAATFAALRSTFFTDKTRDISWRKQQLLALKTMLVTHEQDIHRALNQDLGKCETEARTSETGFLLSDLKHTLKHIDSWADLRHVSTPLAAQPARSYLQPEPLGVVLIIGAWNYPVQLLLAPLIAALAAGNCAIVKPSELAPASSALMASLLPQYLDEDAVAVVEGAKEETQALLALPFDHIFYTGGEAVGKIVMSAAAKHLTPVTLELGGKSPCIVDASCRLDVTARRIVWGKWMNCGQTCIAPDYILIEKGFAEAFLAALEREITKQYGPEPLQSKDYGHIVNTRHYERLCQLIADLQCRIGGERDDGKRKLAPAVVLNPPADSTLMQEEIFGPVLPVIELENIEDSIGFIRGRAKPLALYLFSEDHGFRDKVLTQTSAGSVCVNDTMMFMTNANLPFGGVGGSGMGRYHGQYGFDTFSHLKSVMVRASKFDVPVRYAPYSRFKLWLLKKLL